MAGGTQCSHCSPSINSKPSLFFLGVFLLFVFLVFRFNLFSSFTPTSNSFLPSFFLFGLIAGLSTCAGLLSSLVVSLVSSSFRPLLSLSLFGLGRLLSFTFFGLILGVIGHLFLSSAFNIVLAFLLLFLGLRQFGLFHFSLPSFFPRPTLSPFFLGALTFFLPCGFTLTVQSLALLSSPLRSSLLLLIFSLGTLPPLFLLGLSATKIRFPSFLSGAMILFFSFSLFRSHLKLFPPQTSSAIAPASITQTIKTDAYSSSYFPSTVTIKANTPTRWEISDRGASGCTRSLTAPSLFPGNLIIPVNGIATRDFVSPSPGTYSFSCSMGMITGQIKVVP